MKALRNFLVLMLLLPGCASMEGTAPREISYTWNGQPGAAIKHFGSMENAHAALNLAAAQCKYEMRQMAMRNGFYPGPSVEDECLAAKDWFRDQ
jgi:hypothetical protein